MVKSASEFKKIINNFVFCLKDKGVEVNRLILYGSYAKGKQKPHSDIDIAVVSKTFDKKNLLQRQELLGEVIFPLNESIEAIGYGYSEFKKPARFSFLSEIISTGKVVYKE